MAVNWLIGLYGPARDIVGVLVGRRPPRLKRAIEATHLGNNTWVRVTAWCEVISLLSFAAALPSCMYTHTMRVRRLILFVRVLSSLPRVASSELLRIAVQSTGKPR
jgi:hypothetical protein